MCRARGSGAREASVSCCAQGLALILTAASTLSVAAERTLGGAAGERAADVRYQVSRNKKPHLRRLHTCSPRFPTDKEFGPECPETRASYFTMRSTSGGRQPISFFRPALTPEGSSSVEAVHPAAPAG